jgi:putative membrane protein
MPESLQIRPSLKFVYLGYAIAALLALASLILAGSTSNRNYFVILALAAIAATRAAGRHLRLSHIILSIDDGKLRFQHGVLSRSTRTLELSKIQDIRVDQSLGQRFLGLGSISIETAGESGQLTMAGVDKPQDTADRILAIARPR